MRKKKPMLVLQTICAGGILCLVLAGNLFSPLAADRIKMIFLPHESQAAQVWAAEYAHGEDLRQIMVEQCKRILIEAGYEG